MIREIQVWVSRIVQMRAQNNNWSVLGSHSSLRRRPSDLRVYKKYSELGQKQIAFPIQVDRPRGNISISGRNV